MWGKKKKKKEGLAINKEIIIYMMMRFVLCDVQYHKRAEQTWGWLQTELGVVKCDEEKKIINFFFFVFFFNFILALQQLHLPFQQRTLSAS